LESRFVIASRRRSNPAGSQVEGQLAAMSPRKLNRRSASLRNGSREIEIIFPFCEFSRLCEGDNFRLAVAATVGSTIAIEPAGDSRRRSSRFENARIVSDANCARRAFLVGARRSASCRAGPRDIEILSPFCDFSRLCRAENFPWGRDADPLFRAARARPWRESARSPTLASSTRARVAARTGARALARGSPPRSDRCRLGSCAPDPGREAGRFEHPNTNSFSQKGRSTKIDAACFREYPAVSAPNRIGNADVRPERP
jgi:hypothetical protein